MFRAFVSTNLWHVLQRNKFIFISTHLGDYTKVNKHLNMFYYISSLDINTIPNAENPSKWNHISVITLRMICNIFYWEMLSFRYPM